MLIFKDGKRKKETDFDIDLLSKELRERLDYMHHLSVEDIIIFFDELIRYWNSSKLIKSNHLKNLSDFFSRENLSNNLNISFRGDYKVLDKFIDLGDKKKLLHAQPRGLTCHWLAGNVPILGLFSIFFSLITKNVCLIKASSKGYEELIFFLETLNNIKTDKIDGKDMIKSVIIILIDNEDKENHEKLSLNADIRVAWGGFEAINNIVNLKKSLFCEDIIFGPKYSYAIIDNQSLKEREKKLAQKLAIDVSVFDQYACSSPHTVFIEEEKEGEALNFAKELANQLEFVERALLPKGKIDPSKSSEIISLRGEYELKGEVFNSKGTEWTVIFDRGPGLSKGYFSRVIFVKPIKNIKEIEKYNDRQKQTLGLGFTKENKMKYIDLITKRGIDRCPDIGYLTFYESPWDGMFVFDRLIRWISIYK